MLRLLVLTKPPSFQHVIHSILCNRVILLISKQRAIHSFNSMSGSRALEMTHQRSVNKPDTEYTTHGRDITTGGMDLAEITGITSETAEDDSPLQAHEMQPVLYHRDWTR